MDNQTGIGIGHKTSIETAKEKGAALFRTNSVAGHKHPLDNEAAAPLYGLSRPQHLTIPPCRSDVDAHHYRQFTHSQEKPRIAPGLVVNIGPSLHTGPSEYSQRKEISATPTASVDPYLSLAHPRYGIPWDLTKNFQDLGIRQIYPWQKQCLLGPGLLSGEKNLVYSAPTGGGKSLVADVLMLKKVIKDTSAKALLVLPFVALVQEKVRWLRNIVRGVCREKRENNSPSKETPWRKRADQDSIRVVGFFGGSKVRATWHDFDVGVCTIEKANGLINTAIDDCSISNLHMVVLDELHMVDDDFRGYILELLATKLVSLDHHIQIVGMSATLSDMGLLATWLDAHSYETNYQPVPIREHLVCDGKAYPAGTSANILKTIYSASSNGSQQMPLPAREIQPSQHKELQDPVLNSVVALACETAMAGYGALVFASSRAGCESDAAIISRAMPSRDSLESDVVEKRVDLVGSLRSLSTGIDTVLEQTIPYGVAFHHAGLTTEERDLVANAYDSGTIKICVATCSLAAGINLPARRVILHNARMGRDLVGPSMLRQMRGRAGRKGKDEVGETYLCCKTQDLQDVVDLMHAELPQITSGLTSQSHRFHRAILEIVAIRLATSRGSIGDYMNKTLLRLSSETSTSDAEIDSSLEDLVQLGYMFRGPFQIYEPTQLGKAVVASGLNPDDGLFIYKEIKRALQAFVMDGEMHIIYTFTPVNELAGQVNWQVYRNEMEGLDESGLRVLRFLGIKPTMVNRLAQGGSLKESSPEEKELARIYRRFYLALQLRDICNEIPVHVVARKYGMPRGAVQTLAQTCQGFAAGMIKFCDIMGWGAMAATLDHFADRLKAGARSDLLALAQVTFVKSRTARVFWDNGFKTVAMIANADPEELVPVLMQAQPNKLRLKDKDEEKYGEKLLAKAQMIANSANRLWQLQMLQELDAYDEE